MNRPKGFIDCKVCGGKETVMKNGICSVCKAKLRVYKPRFCQSFSTSIAPDYETDGYWVNGIKILEEYK